MRKIRLFMHAAALFAVSACASAPLASPGGKPPELSTIEIAAAQLTPERIDMAVRAIDLAAVTAKLAVDTKRLTPGSDTAKAIAKLLDQTRDAVNTARRLRGVGDLIGAVNALSEAETTAGAAQRVLVQLGQK